MTANVRVQHPMRDVRDAEARRAMRRAIELARDYNRVPPHLLGAFYGFTEALQEARYGTVFETDPHPLNYVSARGYDLLRSQAIHRRELLARRHVLQLISMAWRDAAAFRRGLDLV